MKDFDINFNKVFYATDSDRAWDNEAINLRDRVDTNFDFSFTHTKDIIKTLKENRLPNKIMINIHPEHWAKSDIEWYEIFIIRKIKNFVKKIVLKR